MSEDMEAMLPGGIVNCTSEVVEGGTTAALADVFLLLEVVALDFEGALGFGGLLDLAGFVAGFDFDFTAVALGSGSGSIGWKSSPLSSITSCTNTLSVGCWSTSTTSNISMSASAIFLLNDNDNGDAVVCTGPISCAGVLMLVVVMSAVVLILVVVLILASVSILGVCSTVMLSACSIVLCSTTAAAAAVLAGVLRRVLS